MNIDWTARGVQVPDSFKQRVDSQLAKLTRLLRGHTEASVIVSQEGDPAGTARQAVELIVRNRLGTFTAREESRELTDSANAALSRLQAQVSKAHDKLTASRRRSPGETWAEEPVGSE